jgi:hypothetical protein
VTTVKLECEEGASSTSHAIRRAVEAMIARPKVWLPALIVGVAYALWLLMFLAGGQDIRDLIHIDAGFLHASTVSRVLVQDPHYRYDTPGHGYDGMEYYFIAADPLNARYYLVSPAYRYARIVYPMLARVLAGGNVSAIPYTMAVINIVAMAVGTLLLAMLLKRRRLSPWLSLIFGFYSGLFVALTRDLAEPLAFTFVLFGIVLIESKAPASFWFASLAFCLAALSRETLAIFPLVYAFVWTLQAAVGRRSRGHVDYPVSRALTLVGISVGPLVCYKVFLHYWLAGYDVTSVLLPELIPFRGLLVYFPWNGSRVLEFICVVVPALICGTLAVRALGAGWRNPMLWALLANIALFVVFLNPISYWNYTASGRVAAGVVPCALLCIPTFQREPHRRRGWLWICAPIWLFLTPVLFVLYLSPGALH